ncbi:hypothetical protein NQ176_g4559 [Zarea fungicola]|uniref:Uncharacterized protein n=1 Tax=Zarea fungicola TaxID=93591 RepID=A0ACC1NDK2_9HYPO|nr:hypothetical protein NQ176_g4559 [Lecanicillium fungicola]
MRFFSTFAVALLAQPVVVVSSPHQLRQSDIACPNAPNIEASVTELAAYAGAVTITDDGCTFNQTTRDLIATNWPTADNAADGAASLAKRLDEGQKFGNGHTNYLGWVVSIGKSFLYFYRSHWRFPLATNAAGLFQLQHFVQKQMASWKTDGFHTADISGGWTLTVQSAQGWFPSMMPESLIDDMIRSVCEDAYSWLDTNNGAYWEVLGSTGVKLYQFIIQPTNSKGTNPLAAHEEL